MTILRAFNPVYIYYLFKRNTIKAWMSLGGCVLCIIGAEAMFADLGHFSVRSIQIAFTCVVFPCLLLAYMDQVAYLMKHPSVVENVFSASIPDGFIWPVFVIASVVAMIASQEMISATISSIKMSMALGCFPRLKIIHTSRRFMGQIYILVINWVLMIMCVLVCDCFKSTVEISNAYGIAKVEMIMVTTSLVTLVMVLIWAKNIFLAIGFPVLFGSTKLIYFSAVLMKVGENGWINGFCHLLPSCDVHLELWKCSELSGVVYLVGHGDVKARKDSWFLKKLVIIYFYAFMRANCRAGPASLNVPHTNLLQVSMTYTV